MQFQDALQFALMVFNKSSGTLNFSRA